MEDIKMCLNCKKIIFGKNKKYCSRKCGEEYRRKINGVDKVCEICGKHFIAPKTHLSQRFCSIQCQGKWQSTQTGSNNPRYKRKEVLCDWCGKSFDMRNYMVGKNKHKFCSIECSRSWYSNVFSKSDEWREESRIRAAKILTDGLLDKTDTNPQLKVNEILESLGLCFENEYNCKYYSIDSCIYYNDKLYFVEVMGRYWHCDRRYYKEIKYQQQWDRIIRDKAKRSYIKNEYGINILYLWEDDLDNIDLCTKIIMSYINDNLDVYDSSMMYIDGDELSAYTDIELQYMNYDLDCLKLYLNITKGEIKSHKQLDKWITFNCDFCGKETEQLKSRYNKHSNHYCSPECRIKDLKKGC